jgi:squalene-hopene/tetraprenyl-beta-curcumene cyclase
MASVVRIGEEFSAVPAPLPWRQQEWAEKLPESIERGAEHLISLQADEGYWVGELEADSTLESDYIYYLNVIGKADPVRVAKLAKVGLDG